MAQKLLKRKPRKVTSGRARTPAAPQPSGGSQLVTTATPGGARSCATASAVLVGTYKARQLAWIKRHGIYNYPVKDGDEFDEKSFATIKELWLYADVKGTRHVFEAEFVGKMTRSEFCAANPTYAKLGPSKNKAYYVFKTSFLDYGSRLDDPFVIARTSDFGKRTAKVKKAIEQFKADGEFAPLEHYLPSDLSKVPRNRLRVCEAAVQLDFLAALGIDNGACITEKGVANGIKYSMIDLFAGAGGLSEGLEEAGFHGVFASEIVPQYAETYRRNHLGTFVATADIRTLDAEKVRRDLGVEKGQIALIAGGPPCQGFSINAPVRSILDQRNHLFKEYLRFVDAFQPQAVLIENVPGLVSFEDGDTLHAILKALGELGYGADVRILGAAYYGVPQMRWRTIIIGLRGKELPLHAFPEPVCHAPIRPNFTATFDGHSLIKTPAADIPGNFVSVEDAIGDLPPLVAGERGDDCKQYLFGPKCDFQRSVRRGTPGVFNHEAPRLSPVNLQRLKYIKPGGNWTDIPHDLLPRGMKLARKSDHTKRYGRLTPNGLASTILTKCDPHWGAYFHYSQDRSLTVREAARCQSFPDHYIFYGSQQEQFAQVGNAVPPMLAKAVGVTIKAVLDEEEK